MDIFCERLKKSRKNMNILQEDAAKMLDIGYSTYRRYEQGGTIPLLTDAAKMAQLFHDSLDYLAGLTDDPTPPEGRSL